MKKSSGHTGFRNGKLFCFNCGDSYEIHYPQPVDMASAIMTQFAKSHKNCKPTWKEPVNDQPENKNEVQNAMWWYHNGEHGMSSETMFNHFCKVAQFENLRYKCHPADPDDFKRCYKLLQAVPQWKERLAELKTLSPVWSNLVDNWDKLTEMYEQNEKEEWKNHKEIGMYEFMEKLGC